MQIGIFHKNVMAESCKSTPRIFRCPAFRYSASYRKIEPGPISGRCRSDNRCFCAYPYPSAAAPGSRSARHTLPQCAHICMNEDLQNIGTVLQDKVRTPADNDAGALLCQIRNDIALNLPENNPVGGAAVAVCQQCVQKAAGGILPCFGNQK